MSCRDGIDAPAAVIADSSVTQNQADGIRTGAGAHIKGNRSSSNGFGGDGAGIHVTLDGGCRIENNHVALNDRGIEVDVAENTIFANSATDNTINFTIVAGNDIGPISSAALATSPWANIEY